MLKSLSEFAQTLSLFSAKSHVLKLASCASVLGGGENTIGGLDETGCSLSIGE